MTDSNNPILYIGCVNDSVKQVQVIIDFKAGGDISINGIFDAHTEKRVMDVQRLFGIAPSGIVGHDTWDVLKYLAEI